jgi:hypothetical protein
MILAYTFISWRTLRQMLKYCWNCFKFYICTFLRETSSSERIFC